MADDGESCASSSARLDAMILECDEALRTQTHPETRLVISGRRGALAEVRGEVAHLASRAAGAEAALEAVLEEKRELRRKVLDSEARERASASQYYALRRGVVAACNRELGRAGSRGRIAVDAEGHARYHLHDTQRRRATDGWARLAGTLVARRG